MTSTKMQKYKDDFKVLGYIVGLPYLLLCSLGMRQYWLL